MKFVSNCRLSSLLLYFWMKNNTFLPSSTSWHCNIKRIYCHPPQEKKHLTCNQYICATRKHQTCLISATLPQFSSAIALDNDVAVAKRSAGIIYLRERCPCWVVRKKVTASRSCLHVQVRTNYNSNNSWFSPAFDKIDKFTRETENIHFVIRN